MQDKFLTNQDGRKFRRFQGYLVFGFSDDFFTPAIYPRPVGAVSNRTEFGSKTLTATCLVRCGAVRNRTYRPGALTLSPP